MKKKAHKTERREAAVPANPNDDFVHIRLCHFCFFLNESNSDVYRCESCRKLLTVEPFWGYLDEQDRGVKKPTAQEEDEETPSSGEAQPPLITGLSVLW